MTNIIAYLKEKKEMVDAYANKGAAIGDRDTESYYVGRGDSYKHVIRLLESPTTEFNVMVDDKA